jgi:hypothetical protein
MTWRTAIGFKPTRTDLAQDLLKAAERHGRTGWQLLFVGRAVHTSMYSPGIGGPEARLRSAFRTLPHTVESVATSCSKPTSCIGGT